MHKTLNYNCGLRISIDFGMIVSQNINKSSFSNRYKNNFFKPKNKEAINNIFKKKILNLSLIRVSSKLMIYHKIEEIKNKFNF